MNRNSLEDIKTKVCIIVLLPNAALPIGKDFQAQTVCQSQTQEGHGLKFHKPLVTQGLENNTLS